MSNICINIQVTDSPESIAKLYVDSTVPLNIYDDENIQAYIGLRNIMFGESEEDNKNKLITEYNKLIAKGIQPSITIEDALPKNTMNDSQEDTSSQPSSLGLTAAQWNSFGVFAENKFKLLNWRYALQLKPIKTNEDINLAIKEVLISTFKELANKAFIDVNTKDVNESNIYEKLWMFFKDGQHKVHPESTYYNHYLLLNNPDTAIKLVLNSRVKIPTGYFNIHNNNKQYTLKHTNQLLNTWTTEEEDLDDMENVSKVTKAIFESIPRYKFIQGEFKPSDSLATFNGIIGGYNLLQEYLYRVPQFDRNKDNEEDPLWPLIANRSLDIYTIYDILEEIFTKDSKFITLFKNKYRPALENLYSLYQFLTKLQKNSSEFEHVLQEIYRELNTTTLQKFSSFQYNKDKEIIEHKQLDPLDSDYSFSDYTKLLRVAYSAKNKWFNFDIEHYDKKKFQIPNTEIVVKLTSHAQNGLTFQLLRGNESLKVFSANTKFEIGTFGIDNLQKVISIKDLGTLLHINNTEQLAEYSTIHSYILAVDLIRCSVINQLIQSSSNTIINPVYGTTIQNEADFKKQLETLIKIPQNKKAQNVVTFKTIQDAWALEPFTVNYYDIYKPVVYMRNDLLEKPVSTMVKTSEGTTLNTNKLSQRGNLFYESTADQRADKNSPSNHFILYQCFAGGHVLRDVQNSDGEVKKAINLNPEEHLTASYIYDYINRIYSNEISLPGPVVSDKSWIPRIDLHMDRSFKIDGESYTLKKILVPFDAANQDEVKNKKLRESTELLQKLTCQELYNYYKKQKDFVDQQYENLRKLIVDNDGLTVVKKFLESKGLKDITENQIKSWFNPMIGGNYYNQFNTDITLKSVKSGIIHALIAYSQSKPGLPQIDWIDNLCNCWEGENLTINPLLEYNLKRYDQNSQESVDWFNRMHDLYISDLIKNNIALKGGSNSLGWQNEYGYHIFATLKIPGKEDLKLTGRSSLQTWEVYRELENVQRFLSSIDRKNMIPEYESIGINSPQFSITKFINFIQSDDYVKAVKLYRGYQQYKKEQKDLAEKNQQTISTETIRNNFITEAIEEKFQDKYINSQEVTKLENLKLEFNPNLINYNLVSKLFEEEFLNSTVGTYLTHPAKGKSIEEKLKNAIGAQIKRNVILSATKTQYLHGRLNTVPNHIKIAIIENLSNDVFNILADELGKGVYSKQQLTDDGATLVDPAFQYLENNSLGENAVGQDKKQFGSYVNPKSGSGFILKTAGFAITNDLMRRSPELYNLSKRMRSLPINPIDLRIWANYLKQRNVFKAIPAFDKNTGEVNYTYYKLTDSGTNSVTWTSCDEHGNISENSIEDIQTVNHWTIHEIWEKVLGGMYSAQLSQDGLFKRLTYNNCDLSNKVLSELMCTEHGQNMKEQLIAYTPTREAVKYGISNPNTKDVYTDNPNYTMTYMTIDTYDLGVQLDAEHSAFESRVSLMTQVMNAAAARGYSIKQGDSLYNALYQITKLSIQDCFDAFVLTNTDTEIQAQLDSKAQNRIASLILEVLNSSGIGASNLLDVLTSTLQKEMLSNEAFDNLRAQIPIDDPSILRQILSKFTSSLQSHAVRLKFPGGQYVLAPADGRIQLWDGKTLDEYGGRLNKDVTDFLEAKTLNNPQITNFAEIKFGKAYRYKTTNIDEFGRTIEGSETIIINNPKKYWDFRQKFESVENKKSLNIKEDVTVPTDLGCEDFIFYDELTKEGYHIWDLYEVWNQWNLMQQYHAATSDEEKQNFLEQLKSNQRQLQEQLNKLTDYGADTSINVVNVTDGSIKNISIDRSRNKYVSFEAILPKYLKKRFNLTDFDTLSTIKKDKFFFYKKTLSNMNNVYNTGTMLGADLCLLGSEYNTYLRYTTAKTVNDLGIPENFTEVTPNTILKNGEKWLTTDDGQDLFFRVPTDSDIRIWKHKDTGERIIITKDVGFFVNQSRFNNVQFFNRLPDNNSFKESLYNHIKDLEEFSDIFQDEKLTVDDFFKSISSQNKEIQEQLNDPTKKSTNPLLKSLKNRGFAQHTALLDSLKFIASRTPAQCHQSFMAMECVAFDHSDRNVAYVSRWQLWLQGSDFDIKQC